MECRVLQIDKALLTQESEQYYGEAVRVLNSKIHEKRMGQVNSLFNVVSTRSNETGFVDFTINRCRWSGRNVGISYIESAVKSVKIGIGQFLNNVMYCVQRMTQNSCVVKCAKIRKLSFSLTTNTESIEMWLFERIWLVENWSCNESHENLRHFQSNLVVNMLCSVLFILAFVCYSSASRFKKTQQCSLKTSENKKLWHSISHECAVITVIRTKPQPRDPSRVCNDVINIYFRVFAPYYKNEKEKSTYCELLYSTVPTYLLNFSSGTFTYCSDCMVATIPSIEWNNVIVK